MKFLNRRKFAFYIGLGLFSIAERLRANVLDDLAAATMQWTKPQPETNPKHINPEDTPLEHWTAAENQEWRWYERENFLDGDWRLTGITTPIHKVSGEPYLAETGYLDESLVPIEIRSAGRNSEAQYEEDGDAEGKPNEERRDRHGRPPSKWLRSLTAQELRIWLKKIVVPEAGVSGMTCWTHLTRDHSFDPELIEGLTEEEQAKLHAAAHYGY